MNFYNLKNLSFLLITAFFCLSLSGCGPANVNNGIEKPEVLNGTIGTIATIAPRGPDKVQGFGIVAGLAGTGSNECPDDLRKKLIKQIKIEMLDYDSINPEAFINSKNTAVVHVFGVMPLIASKGDLFDLRVAPLSSTQTTSLRGGHLFTTNLVAYNKYINFEKYLSTIAHAEGPIFIDQLDSKKQGVTGDYILAGGRVVEGMSLSMLMHNPNFYTTDMVRDLINEKFGKGTADAKGAGEIHLKIPDKYSNNKQKFLAMVRFLYLGNDTKLRRRRILSLVAEMRNNEDKFTPEIALEVIGKSITNDLFPLLSDSDQAVRFHAARCLLNIGDDRALKTLKTFIENPKSKFKVEAIKAVGQGARHNDAIAILNKHVQSEDFSIANAVYEQLVSLNDIAITRTFIADDFFLDTVMCGGPKRIYVARTGFPRIVLFGESMECEDNLFVQSDNKEIMINAAKGANFISVSRKNPKKPGILGPRSSSFKVRDLINTLGEASKVNTKSMKRAGLAIPYCEIIAILEKMCKNGDIKAEFVGGDLPKFPSLDNAVTPAQPNNPTLDNENKTPEDNKIRRNSQDWKDLLNE